MLYDLVLPTPLRSRLKRPLGQLISGPPGSVWRRVQKMIEKETPAKVVCVGDAVSRNSWKAGVKASVMIIDGVEMRQKTSGWHVEMANVYSVLNPKGTITERADRAVAIALKRRRSLITVEGEEDLLTLSAIKHAPLGSFVIYGQPRMGVVLVRVEPEVVSKVKKILSKFETKRASLN